MAILSSWGYSWLIIAIKEIQRWNKGQLVMQLKGKRAMIYDIKERKEVSPKLCEKLQTSHEATPL